MIQRLSAILPFLPVVVVNADELGVHLEEMLDDGSFIATEEGVWVTHEDVNPVTGEVEDKHFWLFEHDGLVFGSGWHHDKSGNRGGSN